MRLKLPSSLQRVAAIMLSLGITAAAQAAEDYRCTIERYSRAEGDSGPTFRMLQSTFVGKQFTVDRFSGITIGA